MRRAPLAFVAVLLAVGLAIAASTLGKEGDSATSRVTESIDLQPTLVDDLDAIGTPEEVLLDACTTACNVAWIDCRERCLTFRCQQDCDLARAACLDGCSGGGDTGGDGGSTGGDGGGTGGSGGGTGGDGGQLP